MSKRQMIQVGREREREKMIKTKARRIIMNTKERSD